MYHSTAQFRWYYVLCVVNGEVFLPSNIQTRACLLALVIVVVVVVVDGAARNNIYLYFKQ